MRIWNKFREIDMFLYLKISFFAIIICLVGGSQKVIASESREKERLLPKQSLINVENKETKRTRNIITTQTQNSRFDKLADRIDRLTEAFEDYENLSEQDKKILRDKWKAEAKKLDAQVVDFRIQICLTPHTMAPKQPPEEFTIPKESLQNLRSINDLYLKTHKRWMFF